jgi:hypothetical protein
MLAQQASGYEVTDKIFIVKRKPMSLHAHWDSSESVGKSRNGNQGVSKEVSTFCDEPFNQEQENESATKPNLVINRRRQQAHYIQL